MVTAEQVERYRRDGIVHLPGAFAEWVEPLLEGIDRVVARAQSSPEPLLPPQAFKFSPQSPLRVVRSSGGVEVGGTMALNAVPHDVDLVQWVQESPAAEITGRLTGSRFMRYWQDATFIKQGGSDDGTPWHNDYCTWPFRGEKLPILWIALTDVGPDDAPLVTVRGSHTDPWRYYSPMSPPGLAVNDEYHAWEELLARPNAPGEICDSWTVRAGDALVMHSKIIHSSQPRRSAKPGRRVSFSTRWLGDDALWVPDPYSFSIAALEEDPRMRAGEALSPALFPPVWTREREAA